MSSFSAPTDQELVVAAKQDAANFRGIIERYEAPLLRYIRRITDLSTGDAQDILQEAFLRVWQNIYEYSDAFSFRAWVYRITHNTTISFYRKRAMRDEVSFDPDLYAGLSDEDELASAIDQTIRASALYKALKTLSNEHRTVLVLYYLEGHSYADISDILKKPVGTVGVVIKRAKEALKAELLHRPALYNPPAE